MNRTILVTTVVALLAGLHGQTRSPHAARIPALLLRLDHPNPKTWHSAMTALANSKDTAVPHLVRRVRKAGGPGRVRAVQVLGRIGARAVAAVPVLLKILPDASSRMQSAIIFALGRLGPYAGAERSRIRKAMVELTVDDPALRTLNHGIAQVMRQHIQQHLEAWRTHARTRLDPRAPVAVIVKALEDPNPFVRELAAELLAEPRPRDDRALAALAKMLGAAQPGKAVMDDVDHAGSAEPGLEVFYDRRIHCHVARAMVRMAPADPHSLPGYEFLLTRPISKDRLEGLVALRRAGPLAAKLLPTLLPMAQREEKVIQREVVTVLGMIGAAAREAIPTLKKLQCSGDVQLAARAKAALASIDRRQ